MTKKNIEIKIVKDGRHWSASSTQYPHVFDFGRSIKEAKHSFIRCCNFYDDYMKEQATKIK